MEYRLPDILSAAAIRGYSPRLASAVNTLLNTESEIEYQEAVKTATVEITGYGDFVSIMQGGNAGGQFGLPVYQPLLLEAVDGTDGELLLEHAVVEFSREKDIVTTKAMNMDVSRKEHISNGDYSITVAGILCGTGAAYPKEDFTRLCKFLDVKAPIPIVHDVLNARGIYEIVITGESFPAVKFSNMQPFSFSAWNEEPLVIARKNIR